MNEFVYNLTLDINCSKEPPIICAGQFDKGRKFEFTITNNGEPYDITGCSAILKGTRSNNTHFAIDCTVLNGKIIAVTDENTLSVRGKSVAKVVIYDADRFYSTQIFVIDVDPSLEGIITESSDYYPIFNRLIKSITDSEKSVNKISEEENITDEDEQYPSIKFLKNYYYDFVEVEDRLAEKYDSSNVEYGVGTLTPGSTTVAKVSSASFVYQRIENTVMLNISIILSNTSASRLIFSDLPFVSGDFGNIYEYIISSTGKIFEAYVAKAKSTLVINPKDSEDFIPGETLAFAIQYFTA